MCRGHRRHGGELALEGGRRCGGFPFWALWLIWPALWLSKAAAGAAAPLLAALSAPIALAVTPLPLLLIGAGLALLLLDRAHGEDR